MLIIIVITIIIIIIKIIIIKTIIIKTIIIKTIIIKVIIIVIIIIIIIIVVIIIHKRELKNRQERWPSKLLHDQYLKGIEDKTDDITWSWLKNGELKKETNRFPNSR